MNGKKIVGGILETVSILAISFGAFTPDVARMIFERDKGRCQCCGADFYKDGIMLHASHFDHDRTNPRYNNPDNGQMECISCHLINHISQMEHYGDEHYHAIVRLATNAFKKGLHTDRWYSSHSRDAYDILELDRVRLYSIFDRFGLNLWDFVDIDDVKNS